MNTAKAIFYLRALCHVWLMMHKSQANVNGKIRNAFSFFGKNIPLGRTENLPKSLRFLFIIYLL